MVTGLVRKCANSRSANSLPHRAELWPILHIFIVLIIIKSFIINDFCFLLLKKNNVVGGGAEHPWEKIGTDLFHFRGREYLLMIDYYSNYPEMALLTSTTATGVVKHMKSSFARHGIPGTVVSDNGPQYASQEFKQFAREYGFEHVTVNPHFPQANGKAEKGVQMVKGLLTKATENGEDPYSARL